MTTRSPLPALATAALLLAGCAKTRDDSGGLPPPSAAAPASGTTATTTPGAPEATAPTGADPHAGLPNANAPAGAGMGGGMGGGATLTKGEDGRAILGPFTLMPPAGWEEKPTTSSMRAAQWRLPGEGGAEDAELVVYFFGPGGAGGVEANLTRWIGQFAQPDGSASSSKAKIEETKVAGQKATTVEVSGRYVAAMMPGAAEKLDKPAWKMLASIVESPLGAYYFKLVGPEATVDREAAAFRKMMTSMKLAPAK